ncbi:MAG TPA: NAD-dependent epimerase/dehydratase family protein, partial [Thermoguttaceae bacterium]|nr:NAD-dependent epimerase/dehydratase family protein [Thermoguttaceae bacterium]
MGKVLVTGASGFVGSHLAMALVARGDEVTCLVRPASRIERLEPLGVRFAYGDVTCPESLLSAVDGVETVYHAAGCTTAIHAEQYDRVNHQGTRNLLQACASRTTPPVLVVVSSAAAAGPAVDDRPRVESDPPRPVSHYGRSKRAAELAAEEFADRVPVTVVRPSIVLGEADRLGLPMFTMISRLGAFFVHGLGRRRYSIIHATDLADLLIRAAEQGERLPAAQAKENASSQGYYFAACGEDPTYAELGRMISSALGRRRVLIFPTPPRVPWVVAGLMELKARIRRLPE